MEDFLTPLESIQPVDAPPFLFTRIQQRIENELDNRVSKKTAYSLAASFVVLFSINIFIVRQDKPLKANDNNLAKAFDLMPDNNLYK